MVVNDFLPFAQGGGANVETQSAYAADPLLPIGNQPGVAISAFNNKALRQANAITSEFAQFVANKTQTDVKDDTNATKLLAQIFAALDRKDPVLTTYSAASGNHHISFKFQVASANATNGATYSDGTTVFTVTGTIAAGLELVATGAAAPVTSGTLTKTGGTGDATITFYAVRAPIFIRVRGVGAGGGGSGSGTGTSAGAGQAGSASTTFGTTLLVALAGGGGANNVGAFAGGSGGGATLAGLPGLNIKGGNGGGGASSSGAGAIAGSGGASHFGGAGGGGQGSGQGSAGAQYSGSGGGGGGFGSSTSVGAGGGSGGFFDVLIYNTNAAWAYIYAWAVGTGGAAGTAGTSGQQGGNGGDGILEITEFYQ